jgi:putative transposase
MRGTVAVTRSSLRWCSDGMGFTWWTRDVLPIAFVLDYHDHEAIDRVVAKADISSEVICDLTIQSVEARIGTCHGPEPIQRLTRNGLIPPLASRRSRGQAFVKNPQTRLCPDQPTSD